MSTIDKLQKFMKATAQSSDLGIQTAPATTPAKPTAKEHHHKAKPAAVDNPEVDTLHTAVNTAIDEIAKKQFKGAKIHTSGNNTHIKLSSGTITVTLHTKFHPKA